MNPCNLPTDVQCLIFVCEVSRVAHCTVSSQWSRCMLAISRRISVVPDLYLDKPFTVTEKSALHIFKDYHLTMRIGVALRPYIRELCIVGHVNIGATLMDAGVDIEDHDMFLARSAAFRAINPNYETPYRNYALFTYMITHGFIDILLAEYSDYDACPDDEEISMISGAIIQSRNPDAMRWIITSAPWMLTTEFITALSKLGHADMLVVLLQQFPMFIRMIMHNASLDTIQKIRGGVSY